MYRKHQGILAVLVLSAGAACTSGGSTALPEDGASRPDSSTGPRGGGRPGSFEVGAPPLPSDSLSMPGGSSGSSDAGRGADGVVPGAPPVRQDGGTPTDASFVPTDAAVASGRVRLLVTSDIENEPDDQQSLVRLLAYSNEFDIEGLVATTSTWLRGRVAPAKMRDVIRGYGKVRDTLLQHAPGFPTEAFLLDRVKAHRPEFGMRGVGAGKDSEGSDHIVAVVDRPDPRPVWVTVWGGANALAQALHKVKATRSSDEVASFVRKLRVYAIGDQDDAGPWVRREFPGILYIVSPSQTDGAGGYATSTWAGISGERFFRFPSGADFSIVSNDWIKSNVNGHGALGDMYPMSSVIMEGDTPSWLYLVPNGLGVPERPDFGSWGGRYARKDGIWTNVSDTVKGGDGKTYTTNQATIWRWRAAYQNDFAARMDWQIKGPKDANHPPLARVSGALVRNARPGERITLDARESSDQDGNPLAFEWMVYPEAGTHKGEVAIEQSTAPQATLVVPAVSAPASVHVVLIVKDGGTPSLHRYARVIVEISP